MVKSESTGGVRVRSSEGWVRRRWCPEERGETDMVSESAGKADGWRMGTGSLGDGMTLGPATMARVALGLDQTARCCAILSAFSAADTTLSKRQTKRV
jgi:hypothetical protein